MSRSKIYLGIITIFLIIGIQILQAKPMSGSELYQIKCAACHGKNGDGTGSYAKRLNKAPRDFTKGLVNFKYGTTLKEIKNTISEGSGKGMPPMGFVLNSKQIEKLAKYILVLTEK